MDLLLTRPGLVAPVPVDPSGLAGPTRGQARGPRWRAASTNRFVPIEVDPTLVDQRIVEAIAGAPDRAAVTGWAGLRWRGAEYFDGYDSRMQPRPVPVAVGDRKPLRSRAGVELRFGWLLENDVVAVDGLPVTRPERSVFDDVCRAGSLEQAVQIVSMACRSDMVSLDELLSYRCLLGSRQFTARFTDAIALSDENLWSPLEATMLLLWVGRGFRRPLCNRPIFDLAGNHVVTPDLFDPIAGVAGEYDGVVHSRLRVQRRDVDRDACYRDLDLEVVTMVSDDLRDTSSFERRLASAYRRVAERPRRRDWTIDLPDGWIDTSTVSARRALTEADRRRLSARRLG